ncbi:MAG TPA: hypothetical protein VF549_20560 [Solirubrobacteraceae bacterium]
MHAAWRGLDGDQRLAGYAAVALLATMFLPWYQATVIDRGKATNPTFSAFGVFSFVEAAIFLVSIGIFLLLFARGEKRAFHLPGGDGTVIFAAGLWSALLLLWRVFDRPDIARAVSDGITWGLFFAFLAAGALAAIGWRIRAAGRPEPPLLRAQEDGADYGPRTSATDVMPRSRRRPATPRPREQATEQLTLEDAAPAAEPPPPSLDPPRRGAPGDAPPRPEALDAEVPPRRGESLFDDDPPTRRMPFSPDDEPTRRAPSSADDEPTPRAPRRPFDVESDDPEPLRPGEIPRSPDR